MKKEPIIAIEADAADAEDRPVSREGLERGLIARRIRKLRKRLDLSQPEFALRFGIPVANLRQYEIARVMPPPAVRAYLTVIEQEPDVIARALARADAA